MSKVSGFKKATPTATKGLNIGAHRTPAAPTKHTPPNKPLPPTPAPKSKAPIPAPPPKPDKIYAKTPAGVKESPYAKTPSAVKESPYAKTPAKVKESPYAKTPGAVGKKNEYESYPANKKTEYESFPGKAPAKSASKPAPAPPSPKAAAPSKANWKAPKPSGKTVINMIDHQNSTKAAKVLGTGHAADPKGMNPHGTWVLPGNTPGRKGPLPADRPRP
jgi:hypothetical protein